MKALLIIYVMTMTVGWTLTSVHAQPTKGELACSVQAEEAQDAGVDIPNCDTTTGEVVQ